MGIRKPKISPEVLNIMMAYSWPGNIRELENCIERALLLSQGKIIRKSHLSMRYTEEFNSSESSPISLRKSSKVLIEAALRKNGRNVTKAARMLGISRPTLYRKMKEFGLS
jgi:DNA-binding NtrC family response regulator